MEFIIITYNKCFNEGFVHLGPLIFIPFINSGLDGYDGRFCSMSDLSYERIQRQNTRQQKEEVLIFSFN